MDGTAFQWYQVREIANMRILWMALILTLTQSGVTMYSLPTRDSIHVDLASAVSFLYGRVLYIEDVS